jgi:flagellar biosynthesis chaperone FliJ
MEQTIRIHQKLQEDEMKKIQESRTKLEEMIDELEALIQKNEYYIKQIRHAIKTGVPAFDRETYLKLQVVK